MDSQALEKLLEELGCISELSGHDLHDYEDGRIDIFIDDEWVAKSINFAHKVIDTNSKHYAKRGQTNRDKIIKDITGGKIAEMAVFFILENSIGSHPKIKVHPVDFEVYSARKKSFDADILVEVDGKPLNIHVKSFRHKKNNKYPVSWMFQRSDTLTSTPSKNDIICPVEILDECVRFEGFYDADKLVGLYRDPIVHQIRHTKLCLYKEDLT